MSESRSLDVGESIKDFKARLRKDIFEAIINAPSVRVLNEDVRRRVNTSLDVKGARDYSPQFGHVKVVNPHLYVVAFNVLKDMIPKLSWDDEIEINHELDHFVIANEHADYQALVFSFGVDGMEEDGTGIRFESLVVRPCLIYNFPEGTSKNDRILIEKEIAGAPKDYLSDEDQEQINR